MRIHSPFVYVPGGRLSLAELSAARLDGDVVEVGEAYAPADTVETTALRAASLASLVTDTRAFSCVSAAWIHGAGCGPPNVHHVQRATPKRIAHILDSRVVYHDPALRPADLVRIAGVYTTTVVRTLMDLAFHDDPASQDAASALAALNPGQVIAARQRLNENRRRSGRKQARATLDELCHEVVTRLTS